MRHFYFSKVQQGEKVQYLQSEQSQSWWHWLKADLNPLSQTGLQQRREKSQKEWTLGGWKTPKGHQEWEDEMSRRVTGKEEMMWRKKKVRIEKRGRETRREIQKQHQSLIIHSRQEIQQQLSGGLLKLHEAEWKQDRRKRNAAGNSPLWSKLITSSSTLSRVTSTRCAHT